jgi:hypothetical protein
MTQTLYAHINKRKKIEKKRSPGTLPHSAVTLIRITGSLGY